MSDRRNGPRRVNRRRLLAALGTTTIAGLAGCSGGGGGDGDDGDAGADGTTNDPTDPDDGSDDADGGAGGTDAGTTDAGGGGGQTTESGGESGELACADLAGDYTAVDTTGRPLVSRWERPSVLGDPTYESERTEVVVSSVADDGDTELTLIVAQELRGSRSPDGLSSGDEEFATVEFGGETVPVGKNAMRDSDGSLRLFADLPYEVDGETRHFRTRFVLNVAVGVMGSVADDCGQDLETAMRHVLESVEPNSDSTVGSEQ